MANEDPEHRAAATQKENFEWFGAANEALRKETFILEPFKTHWFDFLLSSPDQMSLSIVLFKTAYLLHELRKAKRYKERDLLIRYLLSDRGMDFWFRDAAPLIPAFSKASVVACSKSLSRLTDHYIPAPNNTKRTKDFLDQLTKRGNRKILQYTPYDVTTSFEAMAIFTELDLNRNVTYLDALAFAGIRLNALAASDSHQKGFTRDEARQTVEAIQTLQRCGIESGQVRAFQGELLRL